MGKMELSWTPPAETGGRDDLTYSVSCERCDGAACQPCGERVRFEPPAAALQDPRVTVSELEPHLNYTFMVEARSGVSLFSPQRAASSITTALRYTGMGNTPPRQPICIQHCVLVPRTITPFFLFLPDPPKVTSMRLDERGSTSLSLSWAVSRRAHPHAAHRYELMFRKKVRGHVQVGTVIC